MFVNLCRVTFCVVCVIIVVPSTTFGAGEKPVKSGRNQLKVEKSGKCDTVQCTSPPDGYNCTRTTVKNPKIIKQLGPLKDCCPAWLCRDESTSGILFLGMTGSETKILSKKSTALFMEVRGPAESRTRCKNVSCPIHTPSSMACHIDLEPDPQFQLLHKSYTQCCPTMHCEAKSKTSSRIFLVSGGSISSEMTALNKSSKRDKCAQITCAKKPTQLDKSKCVEVPIKGKLEPSEIEHLDQLHTCCPNLWQCTNSDKSVYLVYEIIGNSFWHYSTVKLDVDKVPATRQQRQQCQSVTCLDAEKGESDACSVRKRPIPILTQFAKDRIDCCPAYNCKDTSGSSKLSYSFEEGTRPKEESSESGADLCSGFECGVRPSFVNAKCEVFGQEPSFIAAGLGKVGSCCPTWVCTNKTDNLVFQVYQMKSQEYTYNEVLIDGELPNDDSTEESGKAVVAGRSMKSAGANPTSTEDCKKISCPPVKRQDSDACVVETDRNKVVAEYAKEKVNCCPVYNCTDFEELSYLSFALSQGRKPAASISSNCKNFECGSKPTLSDATCAKRTRKSLIAKRLGKLRDCCPIWDCQITSTQKTFQIFQINEMKGHRYIYKEILSEEEIADESTPDEDSVGEGGSQRVKNGKSGKGGVGTRSGKQDDKQKTQRDQGVSSTKKSAGSESRTNGESLEITISSSSSSSSQRKGVNKKSQQNRRDEKITIRGKSDADDSDADESKVEETSKRKFGRNMSSSNARKGTEKDDKTSESDSIQVHSITTGEESGKTKQKESKGNNSTESICPEMRDLGMCYLDNSAEAKKYIPDKEAGCTLLHCMEANGFHRTHYVKSKGKIATEATEILTLKGKATKSSKCPKISCVDKLSFPSTSCSTTFEGKPALPQVQPFLECCGMRNCSRMDGSYFLETRIVSASFSYFEISFYNIQQWQNASQASAVFVDMKNSSSSQVQYFSESSSHSSDSSWVSSSSSGKGHQMQSGDKGGQQTNMNIPPPAMNGPPAFVPPMPGMTFPGPQGHVPMTVPMGPPLGTPIVNPFMVPHG